MLSEAELPLAEAERVEAPLSRSVLEGVGVLRLGSSSLAKKNASLRKTIF